VGRYGFKLLNIELRRGQSPKQIDFGAADGKHYLDRLHSDALAAVAARVDAASEDDTGTATSPTLEDGQIEVRGDDVVDESEPDAGVAEPQKSKAVVQIDGSVRLVEAVLLSISYGIVGDHSKGIDPQGLKRDVDLTKVATARQYRALVVAPEAGAQGYLAVEVISRSHAATRLPARLFHAAQGHRFKIKPLGAVADEQAVKDLMEGAHIPEVRLWKSVPGKDSSTSNTRRVSLTFRLGKGSEEEEHIRPWLLKWLPTKANRDAPDRPTSAEEASRIAAYLWSPTKDLDFETAEATIENANRSRRLKPLDIEEGFTYDLGDNPLDDDQFISEVSDVVRRIADANQVNLEDDWDTSLVTD